MLDIVALSLTLVALYSSSLTSDYLGKINNPGFHPEKNSLWRWHKE